MEVWEDDDDSILDDVGVASPLPPVFCSHSAEMRNVHAIVTWILGFLLSLQAKFHIPDVSIHLLVKFLFVFISVTGHYSTFMKQMADVFPKSISEMLTFVSIDQSFTKYVVCRKCHTLYHYKHCQEKVGSQTKSKGCAMIFFP